MSAEMSSDTVDDDLVQALIYRASLLAQDEEYLRFEIEVTQSLNDFQENTGNTLTSS